MIINEKYKDQGKNLDKILLIMKKANDQISWSFLWALRRKVIKKI